MDWISVTGSWRYVQGDTQPGIWNEGPAVGSLPIPQAARIAQLLAQHTATTDRCWFAVWSGYGGLAVPTETVPVVAMPRRPMVLFSGPLSAVTASLEEPPGDQRANLWWPDDRAWCVVTDVDLMSTYVGGCQDCIDSLTAGGELEAMPVFTEQRITWDSDDINPQPPNPLNGRAFT
jgi:hypothetical protein